MIYNLDTIECIWYIIYFLITNNYLKEKDITDILIVSNNIFLQYNNNYRYLSYRKYIIVYNNKNKEMNKNEAIEILNLSNEKIYESNIKKI